MIGLSNIESNIITFGLNHRATVTFSSITDETKLICEVSPEKPKDKSMGEIEITIAVWNNLPTKRAIIMIIGWMLLALLITIGCKI